jgi:hypothetical protein
MTNGEGRDVAMATQHEQLESFPLFATEKSLSFTPDKSTGSLYLKKYNYFPVWTEIPLRGQLGSGLYMQSLPEGCTYIHTIDKYHISPLKSSGHRVSG